MCSRYHTTPCHGNACFSELLFIHTFFLSPWLWSGCDVSLRSEFTLLTLTLEHLHRMSLQSRIFFSWKQTHLTFSLPSPFPRAQPHQDFPSPLPWEQHIPIPPWPSCSCSWVLVFFFCCVYLYLSLLLCHLPSSVAARSLGTGISGRGDVICPDFWLLCSCMETASFTEWPLDIHWTQGSWVSVMGELPEPGFNFLCHSHPNTFPTSHVTVHHCSPGLSLLPMPLLPCAHHWECVFWAFCHIALLH